ncbi:MAG TPA: PQQ-binding-like beta-propeller repeat protein, partial [Gemmataceae bacterium]|nr:PQQ-binding-like beta-propeller repeat protein [Gemmataceae bacterium]
PTDHRSDLFSLGSVLYALCTGGPPFRGDTTAAVLKAVGEDAPRPVREIKPDVPEWLGDVIARLHARRPCDRFASAQEVADLLSARLTALQESPLGPTPARAPGVEEVVARPAAGPRARHRRLLVAVCVAALVIVLAVFVAILRPWQGRGQEGQSGDPPPRDRRREAASLELRREDIPPRLLALAGGGDPAHAPPELAAVLGDGRFLFPRIGQPAWMDQSPDGRLLAVPLDGDVVLFEATTGEYIRSLKGPGGRVVWVTFSRDSQLLAATTWREGVGGAVRVWDLQADRELYTKPQPGPRLSGAAAFSADGKRLFAEGGGRIHVLDARSGREVLAQKVPPEGVISLCVSPDGGRLAVTNWQGRQVKVFDWAGDKLAEVRTLGHRWPTGAVVYSPDGKFLASSDRTGFKLWNARTYEEVRAVEAQAHQLAFAPDGRTLFAATTDDQLKAVHTFTRWEVGTGKELPALAVEVSVEPARAFHRLSRDGKVLFVAPQHAATYVREIDTATGKELFPRRGHVAPLRAVAVSPDGRT